MAQKHVNRHTKHNYESFKANIKSTDIHNSIQN